MAEYFHASTQPLEVGTVLECRLFGNAEFAYQEKAVRSAREEGLETLKALLLYAYFQQRGSYSPVARVLKEIIFEEVREESFSHVVSRWNAVFLFPTLDGARDFQNRSATRPHLYLCDLRTDDPLFQADIAVFELHDPLEPMETQLTNLRSQANFYWSGVMVSDRVEVLAPAGTVTVASQV